MLRTGFNIYGIKIGILCLESYYSKLPGHIKNASTFEFPVRYKIVKSATPERIVELADMSLLEPFIEAAKELEREGIEAITTSCGFLCLFQREIADAVNIPVFTSSLIQVPMLSKMLGKHKKVGIITASKSSLTSKHFNAVGIDPSLIRVVGMDGKEEFNKVIIKRKTTVLNVNKLRDEVLSVVKELMEGPDDLGAIVLECTDLSPFINDIRDITRLPIFDIVILTKMVYDSLFLPENLL